MMFERVCCSVFGIGVTFKVRAEGQIAYALKLKSLLQGTVGYADKRDIACQLPVLYRSWCDRTDLASGDVRFFGGVAQRKLQWQRVGGKTEDLVGRGPPPVSSFSNLG